MDKSQFVEQLLQKMEKARPNLSIEKIMTDEFIKSNTKFDNFKEMIQAGIRESGMIEDYLESLKSKITDLDDQ